MDDSDERDDAPPVRRMGGEPLHPTLPVARSLTYDEVHASIIGVAGFPVGAMYANGFVETAVWTTASLFAIALGLRGFDGLHESTSPMSAVAKEPWYFVGVYTVMVILGVMAATRLLPPPTVEALLGPFAIPLAGVGSAVLVVRIGLDIFR